MERLFLEKDRRAAGAQFPRLQVEAKGAEPSASGERFLHWKGVRLWQIVLPGAIPSIRIWRRRLEFCNQPARPNCAAR